MSLEQAFQGCFVVEGSNTLQRLLTSRVDALPQDAQTVLRTASALGNDFTSHALREMHDFLQLSPTGGALDGCLETLRKLGVLVLDGWGGWGDKGGGAAGLQSTNAFRSAMLRDVVYTSLTFEQRKQLHAAAAQMLLKKQTRRRQAPYLLALNHYKAAEDDVKVRRA